MEYLYDETCTFNSNVIKTTENPIDGNSVTHYEMVKDSGKKALWELIGGSIN